MRPDDFDARLHDLLHDAAREIPPNATVVPDLLRRLTTEDSAPPRRLSMRPIQRYLAPALAGVLVLALIVTFVSIHSARQIKDTATLPAATATLVPSASFTPATQTHGGVTIQLDHVDANALRIAVEYHIVTPPPPGDEYLLVFPQVVDDANTAHYQWMNVPDDIAQSSPLSVEQILYFTPFDETAVRAHTLHFIIPLLQFVGYEGSGRKYYINGPWDFTLHVVPAISGASELHTATQTVGGISITPQSITWSNAGETAMRGTTVHLALSGLPKVADPLHHPLFFSIDPHPHGEDVYHDDVLTLPDGTQEPSAYLNIVGTPFDAATDALPITGTGSIQSDGTATVDLGFQGVQLTQGMTLHLTLKILRSWDSYTSHTYPGPWTFTITL